MAKETRPKDYPKLKRYKPSRLMLPTSHYDKAKAYRAVNFVENLCHTKGKWSGKRFWLLPWQEQLIRDIFGIVKADGYCQFRTAFVEICEKVGKSKLAAAIALYMLYADNEPSAEVYGTAADRQQASIVFDVAKLPGFLIRFIREGMERLMLMHLLEETAMQDWIYPVQVISQLLCRCFRQGMRMKSTLFCHSSGCRKRPFHKECVRLRCHTMCGRRGLSSGDRGKCHPL